MDDLVAFGFNIMRLGAMWSGAEPEMGVFNVTYFEVYCRIFTVSSKSCENTKA